jgi:hypothetical protein
MNACQCRGGLGAHCSGGRLIPNGKFAGYQFKQRYTAHPTDSEAKGNYWPAAPPRRIVAIR